MRLDAAFGSARLV
jgi:hypothetical protein